MLALRGLIFVVLIPILWHIVPILRVHHQRARKRVVIDDLSPNRDAAPACLLLRLKGSILAAWLVADSTLMVWVSILRVCVRANNHKRRTQRDRDSGP